MEENQTPLMKQYWDLKAQAGDALLLFRMGDFYELFGDDAVEAARILEITLTSRDKNKANPMPMAGVPHHSIQGYLPRLLKAGKKVAIGEQVEGELRSPTRSQVEGELRSPTRSKEDPKATKGIVRREIVRTFTPGIHFDLEGSESNYVAAIVPHESLFVLACLDASTGEALVSAPLEPEALLSEIGSLPIRHLLRLTGHAVPNGLQELGGILQEDLPSNYLSLLQASTSLKEHYSVESLAAFVSSDAGILALGILVTYTLRTQQQEKLAHLRIPAPLHKPKTMVLGPRTAQHLDLLPGTGLAGEPTQSLYQLINRTKSALGARQLKRWLTAPLRGPEEIALRQEAVRELSGETRMLDKTSAELGKVYDLERISGRINAKLASPRDTLALGQSLATLADYAKLLDGARSPLLKDYQIRFLEVSTALDPLAQRIIAQQKEDAPFTVRDGGVFRHGTNPELDRLLSLTEDGQRWLIELETRERETTGIPSLKVRYNRVFGYYIEVTQAHLKNVPSHYQRKQTTVGAERFFTEELKKFEEEILTASIRQKALEQQLFEELLACAQEQTKAIMEAARILGELDALCSLARLAEQPGWCFPEIDDSMELSIQAGRHPLVDMASRGEFVPNDLELSPSTRLALLITGPNMGGKSTVMRQTALIVILGQMGAPVPAHAARWGAFSSLYTRIGAHDAIARGQSTFMVEMSELAQILHHADDRSLIVLDEIGRGTSTYDGMSVAWATLEWICVQTRARTLFATHYHELTRLSSTLPSLANAHMAVEGTRNLTGGSLRFLYVLKDGPANESFGIHVARIAGLPKPVIQRAWQVLEDLERSATEPQANTAQLSLFDTPMPSEPMPVETPREPHPVLTELESTDLNAMTPIQALNFVAKLQEISRGSAARSGSAPSP